MGRLLLHKNKSDDGYGALGVFSNRWRDWDFHSDPEHGGEIITDAAHREYEKWLDKNPHHAPELWTWHVWGTERKNRADWWAYSGNFFYMHWPLTEEEGKALEEWSKEETLGMSHGFYALGYDQRAGDITMYRTFEGSVLPVDAAANPWTSIQVVLTPEGKKEKDMAINKKKYDALVKLHGKEFADELVAKDSEIAAVLDEAGVDTKEIEAADIVAEIETPVAAEAEADVAAADEAAYAKQVEVVEALKRLQEAVALDVLALSDRMGEAVKGLTDALEAMAQRLQALESVAAKADTEARAAAMPPSLLTAYLPQSILDTPRKTPSSTDSAVVSPQSALAKQAGPQAPAIDAGWFGDLIKDAGKR